MNILLEFLTNESNTRVSCGNRWMVVKTLPINSNTIESDILYTVYERPYRAKKSKVLYEGYYLSTALTFLKGDTN